MASIDLTDTPPAGEGVRTLQLRALAARELPIRIRGYDPDAVDELREDLFSFCADIEGQLGALLERSRLTTVKDTNVAVLEDQIAELTQRAVGLERSLDDAVATRDDLAERLAAAEAHRDDTDVYTEAGDEIATVLRAARAAADDLLRTADELAETTQRDAEEMAQQWRAEATEELEAARRAAEELLDRARQEADDLVAGARGDAAEIVDTARRDAHDLTELAEAEVAAAAAEVASLQQAERQLRVGLQTAGQWLLRAAAGELEASTAPTPFTTSD